MNVPQKVNISAENVKKTSVVDEFADVFGDADTDDSIFDENQLMAGDDQETEDGEELEALESPLGAGALEIEGETSSPEQDIQSIADEIVAGALTDPGRVLEDDDEVSDADEMLGAGSDFQEITVIPIYDQSKCLKCTALFPELKVGRAYKDCHFSNGNEECPAATTQFVIGLNIEQVANRIVNAERKRELKRVSKLMNMLSERSDIMQSKVLSRVAELRDEFAD